MLRVIIPTDTTFNNGYQMKHCLAIRSSTTCFLCSHSTPLFECSYKEAGQLKVIEDLWCLYVLMLKARTIDFLGDGGRGWYNCKRDRVMG